MDISTPCLSACVDNNLTIRRLNPVSTGHFSGPGVAIGPVGVSGFQDSN